MFEISFFSPFMHTLYVCTVHTLCVLGVNQIGAHYLQQARVFWTDTNTCFVKAKKINVKTEILYGTGFYIYTDTRLRYEAREEEKEHNPSYERESLFILLL